MPSLLARVHERAVAAGVGRRLNGCWKFLRHISCYTFVCFVVFVTGSVFFVFGIATVAPRNTDTNPELGWIFFGLGLAFIITAVGGFFGRYLCNRSNRTPRTGPRPVRTRPGGRRVQVHPARCSQPPQVWSTPPAGTSQPPGLTILNENSRSPPSNPSTPTSPPTAVVERRPSNAPPTYDEAIGRNRESVVATEPPPYNPSDASL
uniref:Uncharacterized protein n=1 Tax=Panagrellus redivivus TaxID=6233 RepID=A0A7E4VIW6_PANRE